MFQEEVDKVEEVERLVSELHKKYEDSKSLKFVLHLVHSYYPIQVVSKVNKLKQPVVCSLSHKKVYVDDSELPETYSGVNTNTFLSYESDLAVQKFVEDKMKSSDKRIKFILK
jgi:hypothetical protein